MRFDRQLEFGLKTILLFWAPEVQEPAGARGQGQGRDKAGAGGARQQEGRRRGGKEHEL